jgi:hypothetical protein
MKHHPEFLRGVEAVLGCVDKTAKKLHQLQTSEGTSRDEFAKFAGGFAALDALCVAVRAELWPPADPVAPDDPPTPLTPAPALALAKDQSDESSSEAREARSESVS